MHFLKNRRGFTLIELIVVLAILAIVAAIAVPTAFSSIEKSRTAACAASMENLRSKMQQDAALAAMGEGILTDQDVIDGIVNDVVVDCKGALISGSTNTTDSFCPSGGTYTITYSPQTGLFAITCTKHSGEQAKDPNRIGTTNPIVGPDGQLLIQAVFKSINQNTLVDSTAGEIADTGKESVLYQFYNKLVNNPDAALALSDNSSVDAVKQSLKNDYGMTSWQYNSGGNLVWTSADISSMSTSDKVVVMKYNPTGGAGGTPAYSVWEYKITNTKGYNILNGPATSTPIQGGTDYDTALAAYQAAQKAAGQ